MNGIKILITGEKSYVGTSLIKWLGQWPDQYNVDTISLRNSNWRNQDFSCYDTVLHTAGLVHQKERTAMEEDYYRVNRDLTLDLAKKAKRDNVKYFIFISSMSVYGVEGIVGRETAITKDTPCNPSTYYGKSKLAAEIGLKYITDKDFKVAIVRPPTIYGPGCPGNYDKLQKFIGKMPIFPLINNQRSMIFIDNLSEFLRSLLDDREHGLFHPQNEEFVNTCDLVKLIAKERSKKIYLSKRLSFAIELLAERINMLNKVFGNLTIDPSLSKYRNKKYCVSDLNESIKICENRQ